MMKALPIVAVALTALAFTAFPALAGPPEGKVPAPLLGAGLPGLAVFLAGGAGYLGMRFFRRRQG